MTRERIVPIHSKPYLEYYDHFCGDVREGGRQDSFPCDEDGVLIFESMKKYYEIKYGKRKGENDITKDFIAENTIFEEFFDDDIPF